MTNKEEIMFEIAKIQVKEAIKKLCRNRGLGTDSYDKMIIELFFDELLSYAEFYNKSVSDYLRDIANEWEKTEDFDIDKVNIKN